MSQLGEKVKALRTQRRKTQRQVSERGGCTVALVTTLEQGRRRYVTPIDVDGLARGLEVPPAVLWDCIPRDGWDRRYIPLQ